MDSEMFKWHHVENMTFMLASSELDTLNGNW